MIRVGFPLALRAMKNGILLRKLAEMEQTLQQLRKYVPVSHEQLSADWGLQKILERALQILVEAMIDIGERLLALSGGMPCDTSAAVMLKLKELGVVKDDTAYASMVRFRNLLVHQYEEIDLAIVYGIVTKRLEDFQRFMDEVRAYVETH